MSCGYTAEQKVKFILALLGRRYNTVFEQRVKVSGYLDDMEYALSVNGSTQHGFGAQPSYVFFTGKYVKDALSVYDGFVKQYFAYCRKATDPDFPKDDPFRGYVRDFATELMVVKSESELQLKMDMEGV